MRKTDLDYVTKRLLSNPNISDEKKESILEEIQKGKEYGFETGYPSIDRPWLEFYDLDKYYSIHNDKTVYQDIWSQNKDYLDQLALMYFGGKATYKELFQKIDQTAKSLEEYGIKKGDFVTICCAGIPECIYVVYALAKIGAIANLMPYYFEKDQMSDRISECESKTLIVMDTFYPQIKDAISRSSIQNTIVIPTLNSSPLRFIPQKNKIKLNYVNEVWWNQFIKDGKGRTVPKTFEYEKDYPFCMVYSSGTTGASKAIVLSHDSFQYSVLSYDANTIDIQRGQKMYQIVPPWFSTGLSTSIHLPLHYGVTIFQDPRFERDIFIKNCIKQKVDFSIGPTSMYEGYLDKKLTKGKKLSPSYTPVQGGEALKADLKTQIEDAIVPMGADTKIIVAYGQCECGAQATSQSLLINHPDNSVGIPIPGVSIMIVDDDFNELPYGSRGNIVVNTPCGMLGYYNRPEATSEYFYYDQFGRKWNCTGDIGSMGEKGDLFVDGRASDFTMVGDTKVYNFDVESVISGLADIKNCDCIRKTNDDGTTDLGLHIIFSDDKKEEYQDPELLMNRLADIQRIIFEKYHSTVMVPKYFKIRDDFPYKPSGKRDTDALASEKEGFIFIDSDYLVENKKTKRK